MRKFDWKEGAGLRLQHHLLVGDLSIGELAELFDVDRGNIHRAIEKLDLITKPFPSYFTRKQRHVGLQLVRLGLELPDHPETPHNCGVCGNKLTYNIYGEEDNNATVYLGKVKYYVYCKEYKCG